MSKIIFKSREHEQFYYAMLEKSGSTDSYHRSFFYCMGLSNSTRANINCLFNFKEDCIEQDGLHKGFQTGDTSRLTRLAFNLWNGYTEVGRESDFSPDELFDCGFAPYFFEAIKLRYPEYCKEQMKSKSNTMQR